MPAPARVSAAGGLVAVTGSWVNPAEKVVPPVLLTVIWFDPWSVTGALKLSGALTVLPMVKKALLARVTGLGTTRLLPDWKVPPAMISGLVERPARPGSSTSRSWARS